MHDLIGRTLKGTYEITAYLGEGGMGTVYRAVDRSTDRPLAVKIMHPARMREPGMLTRFRREATAMRRVRHPNAVEVVSHGVDQGLVYLAMELVEGVDLHDVLVAERRLAPERAARILVEVCGALAEAHAQGVVHRDIKPENIMLGGPSREAVKLVDFGIAKPTALLTGERANADDSGEQRSIHDSIPDDVDLADALELTTAGMLVGSPGYMAPEQWSSSKVDGRTDVYACGVLLYQLVTGRLPFEDENPFMVAQRQIYEEPRAPHELSHDVPLALSAIILRAIRPAREDRWQSIAEMRDALRTFLVERTIAGPLSLAATLPIDVMSPLDRTILLDEAPAPAPAPPAPRALPEPRIAAAASPSVARNGRPTPVPPAPRAALARPSRPPPGRAPGLLAQVRVVLALCAAFLTLGFVLGLLLLVPVL